MRILFVTNNFTPYSGGVVSSIQATTDALRNKNHEVGIVSLDFLGKLHNDPDHVMRVACPIRFSYKNNYMAIPWRPTAALEKLTRSYAPDIIHVHHPFLLGESGLHAARYLDIPCVFTYHTLYEHYAHYIPLPKMITQSIIQHKVGNFCKSVDGIIVPSTPVKNIVRTKGIISPIEIIPSALRAHFLSENSHQKNISAKNFYQLLVVSRFVPEKNIPFVFDMLQRLPSNITLILVGYGYEYGSLRKLAFDVFKFSSDRVTFVHKPSQETLLQCYKNADFFVFTSYSDTQGLVVAEAMSQGLPVIAIDGPGQRDVVKDDVNGFIVASAEQAAETVVEISNNGEKYAQLVAGAYKTAENYYPQSIVERLVSFYSVVSYK